jgi:AcrR family transcriptional regulator
MEAGLSIGTRERFVATALQLIAEEGGSLNVNLRQISRRMGCAHTNVYNYFASYQDLLWEAFRGALRTYGESVTQGVDVGLAPEEYLRRTIANLAAFPENNPGLYRFIGSDPITADAIPADILETVGRMKRWLAAVFEAASGPRLDAEEAQAATDIVLAYIDGETLNLINGRVLPSEELRGRIVTNAMRLFALLAADGRSGGRRRGPMHPALPAPESIFGSE